MVEKVLTDESGLPSKVWLMLYFVFSQNLPFSFLFLNVIISERKLSQSHNSNFSLQLEGQRFVFIVWADSEKLAMKFLQSLSELTSK